MVLMGRDLVVTPWHNRDQRDKFLAAWGVDEECPLLVLQHDQHKEGCAVTKNKGVGEAVIRGAEMVVVLDDDCYPTFQTPTLSALIRGHREALEPQEVQMFRAVCDPPSRGTPFSHLTYKMPVAASMGFWTEIGDYCGVRQLAFGSLEMTYEQQTIHGQYFPLCGMNLAFFPGEWLKWSEFIDVARFDDIWMGWIWQREAYRRGHCFNLNGPVVRHSRQSNVWSNLRLESIYLEENDTLWIDIATSAAGDYDSLRALLPLP